MNKFDKERKIMKEACFRTLEELPVMLSIPQVAAVLSISRAGAYELAHCKNFPAMLIGSRIVVPKDKLLAWIETKISLNELCG